MSLNQAVSAGSRKMALTKEKEDPDCRDQHEECNIIVMTCQHRHMPSTTINNTQMTSPGLQEPTKMSIEIMLSFRPILND